MTNQKQTATRNRQGSKCTLFTEFRPYPGGQTKAWEIMPFGNKERSQSIDFDYRVLLVKGGINSGKSFLGAAFACSRAYYDPDSRGLISANEYGQLETSTLVALAEFCEKFNVPLEPHGESPEETARMIASRRLCKIFGASVLVLSANKFGGATSKSKQGGRGLQIRWFWADEYLYSDRLAFETLNGRLGRGAGSIKGQGIITSSLNRNMPYNFAWDIFDDPDRSPELKKLYTSINCLTQDNKSLSDDYVESQMATLTPEIARIELLGEYAIAVEGLVFKYFNRLKHTEDLDYNLKQPIHVSFDFNRSPATAIIAQQVGNSIYVLEEFFLLNSDTFEMAKAVASRVRELSPHTLYIYGDASGNQRTANSKLSNWAIIRNEFEGISWTKRYKDSNPSVTDSINSCNCLFIQNRVLVDSNCKQLIKDFEVLKDDGKQGIDKKSDLMRSHLADCFRYLVHTIYPYRAGNGDLGGFTTGMHLQNPFKEREKRRW